MIVAVIGKGGVGKTTVSALLLRRLLDAKQTPVLAIDADPSNCLGPALGIAAGPTLADLRETLRENGRPSSMSSAEWLALRAEEAIVECAGFDLLTMGRPEGKGCYCYVNNLIRDHLDRLARSYRHVLLDCEAGLEHLSRRTSGRPDALVCVTNRSRMAAQTIRRSLDLYADLNGGLPPRIDLVLNQFDEGEALAPEMASIASGGARMDPRPRNRDENQEGRPGGPPHWGGGSECPFTGVFVIPRDPAVAGFESEGKSLLELDCASPAPAALRAWEIGS